MAVMVAVTTRQRSVVGIRANRPTKRVKYETHFGGGGMLERIFKPFDSGVGKARLHRLVWKVRNDDVRLKAIRQLLGNQKQADLVLRLGVHKRVHYG